MLRDIFKKPMNKTKQERKYNIN